MPRFLVKVEKEITYEVIADSHQDALDTVDGLIDDGGEDSLLVVESYINQFYVVGEAK